MTEAKAIERNRLTADHELSDQSTMKPVIELLKFAREIHSDMTITQLAVLLSVVEKNGVSIQDIQNGISLPSATMSRAVGVFCKHHRKGQPGMGLVRTTPDVMDRRVKKVLLTSDGKKAARQLLNVYRKCLREEAANGAP